MKQLLAYIGLLLALVGEPLLLWSLRRRGVDTIGVVARLSLWLITAIACLILVQEPGWRGYAGVSEPMWRTLGWAALAVVLSFVGASVIRRAQGAAPEAALEASEQFGKVAALSQPRRMLLVVTAGVTEEVLYRAYAIGLGSYLLGSTWLAAGLSLVAFTLGHFRWGLAHLWPVFWAGAVMSGVFVASRDILACVLAHVLVDAVGVFVAPAMLERQKRHAVIQREG